MSDNRFPRSGDIVKTEHCTFRITATDLVHKKCYFAGGGGRNWDSLVWNGDGHEWDVKPTEKPNVLESPKGT